MRVRVRVRVRVRLRVRVRVGERVGERVSGLGCEGSMLRRLTASPVVRTAAGREVRHGCCVVRASRALVGVGVGVRGQGQGQG